MMNSCRSGVFFPMKNESSSSLLVRWCRFTGSCRMFSPMKSLNSPAEISPYQRDFHAFRNLPEPEEGLDQLALAAHGHLGEALEPFAVRDFGSGFQPSRKEFKLGDGNFPLVHAKPQMFEQGTGDAAAANSRHRPCRRRTRG